MDVTYPYCCGLDVHKKFVTACVLTPGAGSEPAKTVREFRTMTGDLLALADWLDRAGVTHVAMESTGVLWQPIWNLLEERFTLLLVNAQHVTAVPGRKTDVQDAEWLAELLRFGLLAPSFVPDRAQRELRELTRYRTSLVQTRTAEVNRLHKTLDGANIKLGAVVSDLTGVSARAMLEQLTAGNEDAAALAQLAYGAMRTKLAELEAALYGRLSEHQRFMIAQHLIASDTIDAQLETVQTEIDRRMAPVARELAALDQIPGIGLRTATVIIAEIGPDMTRFPSAAHLSSWAAMCPGQHASAGKQRSGRTRTGNRWLRTALTEAAQAAGRSHTAELGARYRRLAARRGKKKAAVAVGRVILEVVYHVLSPGECYDDSRVRSLEQGDPLREQRRLVRRLEEMGHQVILRPAA
jgi:transposase